MIHTAAPGADAETLSCATEPGVGYETDVPAGSASMRSDVEELLGRMRNGDRKAAGDFMVRYSSRIRRRIRGKLNPLIRRLFDSEDIISTLGRRLDLYVRNGKIKALSEAQFWSLVVQMANHAVIDKARLLRRLEQAEGEDSDFAHLALRRLKDVKSSDIDLTLLNIDDAMEALSDELDRTILTLWLARLSHTQIASHTGLAATAVRKRWQAIRGRLSELLEGRIPS